MWNAKAVHWIWSPDCFWQAQLIHCGVWFSTAPWYFYWNIRHFYESTPSFVMSFLFFGGGRERGREWLTNAVPSTNLNQQHVSERRRHRAWKPFCWQRKESGSEIQCSRFLGEGSWKRASPEECRAECLGYSCFAVPSLYAYLASYQASGSEYKDLCDWWWSATGFNAIIQPAHWWKCYVYC